MCKDGKCQENASKSRPVIVSLGRAARDMAALTGRAQMVVQMTGHLAIGNADPDLQGLSVVIISVDPTTTDEEIERKADQFLIDRSRSRTANLARMLEAVFGLPASAAVVQPAPGA